MGKYVPLGETRKRYTIGIRSVIEKPLTVRALACKVSVEHIIEDILECWVAQERGKERLKSELLREGVEGNVTEEENNDSSEDNDEDTIDESTITKKRGITDTTK